MSVNYAFVMKSKIFKNRMLATIFQMKKMLLQSAHRWVNPDGIIIQNNQNIQIRTSQMVQSFQRHSRNNRSIPDYSDVFIGFSQQLIGNCHSGDSRNGSRRMPRSECVKFAFVPCRKSSDTVELTK